MAELKISESAIEAIQTLIEQEQADNGEESVSLGQDVRVYLASFSLGGPEWGFAFDSFDADADESIEVGGFRIIVNAELLELVGGLDIDYDAYSDVGFDIKALGLDYEKLFDAAAGCGGCMGACAGCAGSCHGHDLDDNEAFEDVEDEDPFYAFRYNHGDGCGAGGCTGCSGGCQPPSSDDADDTDKKN